MKIGVKRIPVIRKSGKLYAVRRDGSFRCLEDVCETVEELRRSLWVWAMRRAAGKANSALKAQQLTEANPWLVWSRNRYASQNVRGLRRKGLKKTFQGFETYPTTFWGTSKCEPRSAIKRLHNQINNRARRESDGVWKTWADGVSTNIRKRSRQYEHCTDEHNG